MDPPPLASRRSLPSFADDEIIKPPALREGSSSATRARSFPGVLQEGMSTTSPHDVQETTSAVRPARKSYLPRFHTRKDDSGAAEAAAAVELPKALTTHNSSAYDAPSSFVSGMDALCCNVDVDKILGSNTGSMEISVEADDTNLSEEQQDVVEQDDTEEAGQNHGFEITLMKSEETENSKSSEMIDDDDQNSQLLDEGDNAKASHGMAVADDNENALDASPSQREESSHGGEEDSNFKRIDNRGENNSSEASLETADDKPESPTLVRGNEKAMPANLEEGNREGGTHSDGGNFNSEGGTWSRIEGLHDEASSSGSCIQTQMTAAGKRGKRNTRNCSKKWTGLVSRVHRPILTFLHGLSQLAARNPIRTVVSIILLSIAVAAIGLATNFTYTVDETIMWTPFGTPTGSQRDWIAAEWGAQQGTRPFVMFLHADGRNILGQSPVAHLFFALDQIRSIESYDDVCKKSTYVASNGENTCDIHGAVQFWNSTTSIFEEQVTSDEDAIVAMSAERYPNNVPVVEFDIFGYPQRSEATGLLTSVISYTVSINFPVAEESVALEQEALDIILQLRDTWAADPDNILKLEAVAQRTYSDEFTRAIVNDLYLLPIVFIMMSVFTACAFSRRHKVYSRSLLGIGAVFTCLLSITTGYGLLFICGIPLTTATQMLPFIILGIGLDDAFIIMGSFTRKDPAKNTLDRVHQTIDDVGVSIVLTSTTSSFAFALGCLSNVPTIYWMSLYAFPMIIIDFFYQITFFIALLVLDERRIQQNRRDVCTWITIPTENPEEEYIAEEEVRDSSAHDKTVQNLEQAADGMEPMYADSSNNDGDQSSNLMSTPSHEEETSNPAMGSGSCEVPQSEKDQSSSPAMSSGSCKLTQLENERSSSASSQGYKPQQSTNEQSSSQSDTENALSSLLLQSNEVQQPVNKPTTSGINDVEQVEIEAKSGSTMSKDRSDHYADRWMAWYGEQLLRPWVKGFVILGFTVLAAMGAYSASKLSQKFEFTDLMPSDSYAVDFFDAIESYSLQATVSPYVYFRHVDQGDESIQNQMVEYLVDLVVDVDAIVFGPHFFWLRDFHDYVDFAGIQDLDFKDQLDQFLSVPVLFEMYNGDILRDENGTLISSRCLISMANIPQVDNLHESIEALEQQRAVTMQQPINQGSPDGPFFNYSNQYNIWEFFAVCVNELTMTVVLGVIAVSIISVFFVPHWSAVFFVAPLISILNVELLGVLQWAGMHVNAITYITIFMAIGLFVDYIMHVLFRYYESAGNRREKVLEMLRTMGTSILLGGLSTLLGTVPLVFSSSGVFYTVFIAALGLVTLGMGHGLILLPVLLSMFGTEEQVILKIGKGDDGTDDSSAGRPARDGISSQSSISGNSNGQGEDESDSIGGGNINTSEIMGSNKATDTDPPSAS